MKEHIWDFLDNIVFTDYICRNCKMYGRVRDSYIVAWNSLLSCQEIREKLESHQFNGKICNKCGWRMNSYKGRYYWFDEVLNCDEVIIKGIIE
jgi:hypothetical protein